MSQQKPTDPNDPLAVYWAKPVSELVEVENSAIAAGEAERHTVFALLVMGILFDAFNGNKRGATGTYPWRQKQKIEEGRYRGDSLGDRYFGHNIGCIAVDHRGEIIDFEFNHNDLYNSSAEHAEARLVRRIFNLNQIFDDWQTIDPSQIVAVPYANVLSGVTLYTSLESCAQCSGIMALGNIKSVIYLQSDPGQYRIGNIMYNLSNPLAVSHPSTHGSGSTAVKYGAPEPVSADLFGFEPKRALEAAYDEYREGLPGKPFWTPESGRPDNSSSITSFLCTDLARDIYEAAAARLDGLELAHADYRPEPSDLSNAQALAHARRFRIYAAKVARRGTPHR
jgi:tRNA(Arg) A34 adenosine deaminase TadA